MASQAVMKMPLVPTDTQDVAFTKQNTGTIVTSTHTSVALWAAPDFVLRCPLLSKFQITAALDNQAHRAFAVTTFEPVRHTPLYQLSAGATKIFNDPNAGGNSINSEAFSFEVLQRLIGVRLLKSEMEIQYVWAEWKKTDFTVSFDARIFGVSVTRAYNFRGTFTHQDAVQLLTKKLYGVNVSSAGVCERDKWTKQILHIWTPHPEAPELLYSVYANMDEELKSNTVVIVTLSRNSNWLYRNDGTVTVAQTATQPASSISVGA
eukprot:GILJ01001384.1.p1 GENE.GILJ01001384.1~~GILJ01001384.1.p1  ORF type:complete len:263 (+),score=35.34 GILJ01001384.1:244-1032(+)